MNRMTDEEFIKELEKRADAFFNECLIEELEIIKENINSDVVNCRYDEFAYSSGLQKAIELIDKRITELKGSDKK